MDSFRFAETDRMMIADPEGREVQKALADGRWYVIVTPDQQRSGIQALLRLAALSSREDVKYCCEVRISILLRAGGDPRERALFSGLKSTARSNVRLADLEWNFPVCPTACSIRYRNLDLWVRALKRSGMTQYNINSVLDEEMYAGVPQLLSGSLKYMSVDECRVYAVEMLSEGDFTPFEIVDIVNLWEWHIGVNLLYRLNGLIWQSTILDAQSAVSRKTMPGSWTDGVGDVYLVPGVDFELPARDRYGKDIDWRPYITASNIREDLKEQSIQHLDHQMSDGVGRLKKRLYWFEMD